MIDTLVENYQKGAITVDHLVTECLLQLDPDHPDSALAKLPSHVLERMLKFVRDYRPGQMRANYGTQPALDQVRAAQRWIESKAEELRLCV